VVELALSYVHIDLVKSLNEFVDYSKDLTDFLIKAQNDYRINNDTATTYFYFSEYQNIK
jgi:hypothetical protein